MKYQTLSFLIPTNSRCCLLFSLRQPIDNLTPEERDARTVFCMQLAARIRARDLEDFFSAVGKVSSEFLVPSKRCKLLLYYLHLK